MKVIIEVRCGPAPPRPKKVILGEKRQVDMANFGYTFLFEPTTVTDVLDGGQRELTVTVNGGDPPQVKSYPGNASESDEWVFADSDRVIITQTDIDRSGNRSQPSAALEFNVVDDVAPPQPGTLSIARKRQIDTPTPPEPTPPA